MQLWKRQYRVVFPDIGLEFNNLDNQIGLKVSFDIDKDLTEETNKSKLTLYNLSDETRAKVETADTNVELYAGYEQNGGPVRIFSGTVIQSSTKDDGKDVSTELTLSDGQLAVRDSVFSLSYSPGTSGDTIMQAISRNMGLPLVYGDGVEFGSFDNGYSFVGNGIDALSEICNGAGCTWSIQDGVLDVILSGGVLSNKSLVFAADSGLIGSPERIIKANHNEDEETPKREKRKKEGKEKPEKKAGWKIKTLLAPTISPGDALKVESRLINSWFRVETVKHSGDSEGGDWASEIELIEGMKDADG